MRDCNIPVNGPKTRGKAVTIDRKLKINEFKAITGVKVLKTEMILRFERSVVKVHQ